jgi:hypothetical protein
MISVASIAARLRPRMYSNIPAEMTSRIKFDSPSMLPHKFKPHNVETAGGFPVKLLETLVRLQKILKIKQFRVNSLRDMNTEAERRISMGISFPPDFVRRYATSILELDRLNVALSDLLHAMQDSCGDGVRFYTKSAFKEGKEAGLDKMSIFDQHALFFKFEVFFRFPLFFAKLNKMQQS